MQLRPFQARYSDFLSSADCVRIISGDTIKLRFFIKISDSLRIADTGRGISGGQELEMEIRDKTQSYRAKTQRYSMNLLYKHYASSIPRCIEFHADPMESYETSQL